MGWVWMLFALAAGVFLTMAIMSIIEWADKSPVTDWERQREVWRRIVTKARDDESA